MLLIGLIDETEKNEYEYICKLFVVTNRIHDIVNKEVI